MYRTLAFLLVFFSFTNVALAATYSNDSNSVDINYTGPTSGSIPGNGTGEGGDSNGIDLSTVPEGGGAGGFVGSQSGVTIPVTVVTDQGSSGNDSGAATSGNAQNGASTDLSGEDILSTLFGHQAVSFGLNSGDASAEWGTITISAKKAREALAARRVSRLSIADLLNSRFFTRQDFTLVAASKILENKTIEQVILTLDTLTVTYRSEGRLFAVFPFSYPIKLTVNPNLDTREKRIQVTFPWYRFFLQTFVTRSELQRQLDAAVTEAVLGADAGADAKTKVLIAVTQVIESRFDTVEGTVQ